MINKKQIFIYLLGIIILSTASQIILQANIGSSAVSSFSMILYLIIGKVSYGTMLFIMNICFVLIFLLVYKNIKYAIISLCFSLFASFYIDFVRWLFVTKLPNDEIYFQIPLFIIGFVTMSFGIALVQYSNLVKLPFELLQQAISKLVKKDLNFVRVFVEVSLVIITVVLFVVSDNPLLNFINIGTLITMLLTGPLVYNFNNFFKKINLLKKENENETKSL